MLPFETVPSWSIKVCIFILQLDHIIMLFFLNVNRNTFVFDEKSAFI